MKYKIIIEAIVDIGDYEVGVLPYDCQPNGIAEKLANMAIQQKSIGAEHSSVISVTEYEDINENKISQ